MKQKQEQFYINGGGIMLILKMFVEPYAIAMAYIRVRAHQMAKMLMTKKLLSMHGDDIYV